MKISIKDIGAINAAEVDLDKISLIVGLNNTGKSTVCKSLYAFIRTMHRLNPERISTMRLSTIVSEVHDMVTNLTFPTDDSGDAILDYFSVTTKAGNKFSELISKEIGEEGAITADAASNIANQCFGKLDEAIPYLSKDTVIKLLERATAKMVQVSQLPITTIVTNRLNRAFKRVFNNQVSPLMKEESSGSFGIEINNCVVSAQFQNGTCENYIQNAPIPFDVIDIDNIEGDFRASLNQYIEAKKGSAENSLSDDLRDVTRKELSDYINAIIPGTFTKYDSEIYYCADGIKLNVLNLSDGMKSMAIIKTLIENGINEGDIVILDEPEIHLHIQWQLKYAELIVLMQKKLNIRIIIATHSPFFVEAISKYAELYDISEGVSYHMTSIDKDGMFNVINVDNNLDSVYDQMLSPISELKELRTISTTIPETCND